jgi:hypothetical protein
MAKGKEIEVSVAEVVDYLKLNGGFSPALGEVVGRKVTAEAAKKSKIRVTTGELQKAADVFRIEMGLLKAKDTEKWLKSSGISVEAFEEYLETNLLIQKFKNSLEKKASKKKYASSVAIKDAMREMIYDDWLKGAMK